MARDDTEDEYSDDVIEEENIKTVYVEEYSNKLDENSGNIGYILIDFPLKKKPVSDRNLVNWGTSQSQRGKTTMYPCAGYFKCKECEIKVKRDGTCSRCKKSLIHFACGATPLHVEQRLSQQGATKDK